MGMKLHHSVSENSRPRKAIKEGLYFPFRLRIGPLINAFTDGGRCRSRTARASLGSGD